MPVDLSHKQAPRGRWIGIGRACQILGVNESTLRTWTDAGKVRAFLTPGGHRRYLEDDLLEMTARSRPQPAKPDLTMLLLASREGYEGVARHRLQSCSWFQNFDEHARRRFRILGNSVLSLLIAYLSGGRREREHALVEGREVATQHGREAADLGLTLSQATEAFLIFRNPVLDAINNWVKERKVSSARTGDMLKRLNQFMDELLLAMASAHEARTAEIANRGHH